MSTVNNLSVGEMSLAELLEMYHSKAEEVDLTDVEENGRNDESGGDSSDNGMFQK